MQWKASEAVSEGNGPLHQEEEFGFGQPEPVDVYRQIKLMMSHFEEQAKMLEKRLTSLEHGARQPRLAMEADGHADTKTQERTKGAATAVQYGPMTNSTSFGVKAEPPALPCRGYVVVASGHAEPRSCLPSLEMRSPTAAGGLIPTGEASTATGTTSNEPLLWFYATEEMNPEDDLKKEKLWASTPYASYDNSVFQGSNLSAAPYCRRVVETKFRQNKTFDPGGSQGHLCACPFLGSWRALVCGEVICAGEPG